MEVTTTVDDAESLIRRVIGKERGSVLDLLRARAELHPDKPFLTWRAGPRVESWTYAQAWAEVERTGLLHE